MVERKLLHIFTDNNTTTQDKEQATIIVTYTTYQDEKSHRRYIKTYAVWVREDMAERLDILNYANMYLRETFIYKTDKKRILEKDLYKSYQVLFADKLWNNYKVTKETFDTEELAVNRKPYRNFNLFTDKTMQQTADKLTIRFTQEAQKI